MHAAYRPLRRGFKTISFLACAMVLSNGASSIAQSTPPEPRRIQGGGAVEPTIAIVPVDPRVSAGLKSLPVYETGRRLVEPSLKSQPIAIEVQLIEGPKDELARIAASAHNPKILQASATDDQEASKRWPLDAGRGTAILSKSQVSELLSNAHGDARFKVTSVPKVTGLNGQTINVDCGPRKSYSKGHQPDGKGGWVAEHCTCCDGPAIVLRPLTTVDGHIELESRWESIQLGPMRTFPPSSNIMPVYAWRALMQAFGIPYKEPQPPLEMHDGVTTSAMRTVSDLAPGHSLAVWGLPAKCDINARGSLLVLVTVRPAQGENAKAGK